MSFKDWDEQKVREHNERIKKSRVRNPSSVTEPEPDSSDAAKAQNETQAFNARVNITFTVYRHRLLDPDNNFTKHIVDTIVNSGLLRNDTPDEIEEVRYRQVKVPNWETEKTVVLIESVE